MTLNERVLMVDLTNPYDGGEWHGYADYQWYRNGHLIRHATTTYYHEEDYGVLSGCFYVMVASNDQATEWMSSDTICVNYVGIDDLVEDPITLTPNPVERGGMLHIGGMETKSLTLYDIQGRQTGETCRGNVLEIGVSAMPGLYLLEIEGLNGKKYMKKILVR